MRTPKDRVSTQLTGDVRGKMMLQGSAEQRQAFPQPPIERGEAGQVVPGAYEAKLGHLREEGEPAWTL